jgi:hypothetical protein
LTPSPTETALPFCGVRTKKRTWLSFRLFATCSAMKVCCWQEPLHSVHAE